MFAITGNTGNVGGELARELLAEHKPVCAVVIESSGQSVRVLDNQNQQ